MEEPKVHCPKCHSTDIHAAKKGFSGRKAVAGAFVTGGIGLLAGTIGSNKIKITCLNCGHVFKPGDNAPQKNTNPPQVKTLQDYGIAPNEKASPYGGLILMGILFAIVIFLLKACIG